MQDIEDLGKQFEVISASRRTDIPAFYLDDYIGHFVRGYINVPNPRNRIVYRVNLRDAKCIAWWSKDYARWIEFYNTPEFQDVFGNYVHKFNFTINSESPLEPGVPPLRDRLDQLRYLAQNFGPNMINLRFDPVVIFRKNGKKQTNLTQFTQIAEFASSIGINRITFSFCIDMPQVKRNLQRYNIALINLTRTQKERIMDSLLEIVEPLGITLCACNDNIVNYRDKIKPAQCISPEGIPGLKRKSKDPGQRVGCHCIISRDIGLYTQVCSHGCLYCYANPKLD
jgi:hypothetical protein